MGFSFELNQMKPKIIDIRFMKKTLKENVTACAAVIPKILNKIIDAASLVPKPEMDMGSASVKIIIGKIPAKELKEIKIPIDLVTRKN